MQEAEDDEDIDMPEPFQREKGLKRPLPDSGPQLISKRPGKDSCFLGTQKVGEARYTRGSSSGGGTERESQPSSSCSASLLQEMDTVALGGEGELSQQGVDSLDRLPQIGANLGLLPPAEAGFQVELMEQRSTSSDGQFDGMTASLAFSTCSSNFDSHASIHDMTMHRCSYFCPCVREGNSLLVVLRFATWKTCRFSIALLGCLIIYLCLSLITECLTRA
jgi:hypothetical protein